ncbi:MAG: FkbM family methyltransferase [Verrucomicrobia bacterium]|nr:MAG: FkbM family methyltransferase [Verrucomicrobiota bacterium]
MSLKDVGRKIYQCIPAGTFRQYAAAWAYRRLHGAALTDCCVENGLFTVRTKDGVVVRTVVDFDPESLIADFSMVPRDGVVMDVGGNIGAVAVYLAAKVGPAGRVIAYEPDEHNLAVFRRNLEANGSPAQVQLVPKGISDHEGTLEFFSGGNYTSSFQQTDYVQREVKKYNVVRIPVTTLDAEATRLNLTRLDFVKMDIEGSEVAALQGAPAVLRRFHPAILVETHIVNGQSTAAEVERLLAEFGYRNIIRQTLTETPGIFATPK